MPWINHVSNQIFLLINGILRASFRYGKRQLVMTFIIPDIKKLHPIVLKNCLFDKMNTLFRTAPFRSVTALADEKKKTPLQRTTFVCLWWDKNSLRFCWIQVERTGRKKKSVAFQLPMENKQMLALEFLSWLMVRTKINVKLLLENFELLVYFDFFVCDWLK